MLWRYPHRVGQHCWRSGERLSAWHQDLFEEQLQVYISQADALHWWVECLTYAIMSRILRPSTSALLGATRTRTVSRFAQLQGLGSTLTTKSKNFSSTPAPPAESSQDSPFAFLPNNSLVSKTGRGERVRGLTEIRGSYYNPVTFTYLDELLSDWGGSSSLSVSPSHLFADWVFN